MKTMHFFILNYMLDRGTVASVWNTSSPCATVEVGGKGFTGFHCQFKGKSDINTPRLYTWSGSWHSVSSGTAGSGHMSRFLQYFIALSLWQVQSQRHSFF